MPLVPGQVVHGRYRIIAPLHKGGMGAVYEAMDSILNVRCAVKEMTPYPGTAGTEIPELREQFRQEARLLADLRHPNLPRVTDHFDEDGNAYLVMDFIYGKRLDEIIAQEGELPEEEVLDWTEQLIGALAHCHERGVIHRDIKPQNVIITPQGQAILVDFGLAKLMAPDDPRTRTVMRGLGTPEYAPPEQYDAKRGRTDARTDVYSLGATLYHALTGHAPPTVTERIVEPESLVPLRQHRRDLDKALEEVLKKAMALQPIQRFQSIERMREALFGPSPAPVRTTEETVPAEAGIPSTAGLSQETVSLPPVNGARVRVDRRLGAALAIVVVASLVIVTSLVADRINAGNAPTNTPTSTISATATATRTRTATATPSPTPTLTPSPTARPSTRIPEWIDLPRLPGVVSPDVTLTRETPTYTPTATIQVVLPTATPSPIPPTNTPPPPPPDDGGDEPQPQPTQPPPTQPPPTQPPPTQPRPTPAPADDSEGNDSGG